MNTLEFFFIVCLFVCFLVGGGGGGGGGWWWVVGGGVGGGGGGGGGAVMSFPRWGHLPRVEGWGMRALSQLLSDESLSHSLKHISTGSTHFTFHEGALISCIYISCFHDDVIKWKHVPCRRLLCREFTGDCREFTGERGIPLTQTSDAELWCFLWSAPEQTVE